MKIRIATDLEISLAEIKAKYEANGDTFLPEDQTDFEEMASELFKGISCGSLCGYFSSERVTIFKQELYAGGIAANDLITYLEMWFPRLDAVITPIGGRGFEFCITITQGGEEK